MPGRDWSYKDLQHAPLGRSEYCFRARERLALRNPDSPIQGSDTEDDIHSVVERHPARVLLLSANPAQLDMVARQAPADRFECVPMTDIEAAFDYLQENPVEIFVVDENLNGFSGVDVLVQAREIDPDTAFMLVVDEDLPVGVASDALNQADVSKILLSPYELDEWVEYCEDAARRHHDSVRTQRNLNLSRAKVRRLNRSVEQTKRDLKRKSRQLEQIRKAPIVPPSLAVPRAPAAVAPAEIEQLSEQALRKLHDRISSLLKRVILASPHSDEIERLRRLVVHCARELQWPASEIKVLNDAALFFHALIDEFPEEKLVELRDGVSARHAAVLSEMLELLPGFSDIAQLIAFHHGALPPPTGTGAPTPAPRGALLLQILSLYDELANDAKLLASEQALADPLIGLSRASETVLRLARDEKLDLELANICIKELIPRTLGRSERCIPSSELSVGMILSRTIYADNLVLIRAGEALNAQSIERLVMADENQKYPGFWVQDQAQDIPAQSA